jgi:hypothetical protein
MGRSTKEIGRSVFPTEISIWGFEMRAEEVLDLIEHVFEGSHSLPWKRGANAVMGELKARYKGDMRKSMSIISRLRSRMTDKEKLKVLDQVAEKIHQQVVDKAQKFAGKHGLG